MALVPLEASTAALWQPSPEVRGTEWEAEQARMEGEDRNVFEVDPARPAEGAQEDQVATGSTDALGVQQLEEETTSPVEAPSAEEVAALTPELQLCRSALEAAQGQMAELQADLEEERGGKDQLFAQAAQLVQREALLARTQQQQLSAQREVERLRAEVEALKAQVQQPEVACREVQTQEPQPEVQGLWLAEGADLASPACAEEQAARGSESDLQQGSASSEEQVQQQQEARSPSALDQALILGEVRAQEQPEAGAEPHCDSVSSTEDDAAECAEWAAMLQEDLASCRLELQAVRRELQELQMSLVEDRDVTEEQKAASEEDARHAEVEAPSGNPPDNDMASLPASQRDQLGEPDRGHDKEQTFAASQHGSGERKSAPVVGDVAFEPAPESDGQGSEEVAHWRGFAARVSEEIEVGSGPLQEEDGAEELAPPQEEHAPPGPTRSAAAAAFDSPRPGGERQGCATSLGKEMAPNGEEEGPEAPVSEQAQAEARAPAGTEAEAADEKTPAGEEKQGASSKATGEETTEEPRPATDEKEDLARLTRRVLQLEQELAEAKQAALQAREEAGARCLQLLRAQEELAAQRDVASQLEQRLARQAPVVSNAPSTRPTTEPIALEETLRQPPAPARGFFTALLSSILTESDFLELQEIGWSVGR